MKITIEFLKIKSPDNNIFNFLWFSKQKYRKIYFSLNRPCIDFRISETKIYFSKILVSELVCLITYNLHFI